MDESAAVDPVLIWIQQMENAPDIDPLPSISVIGFRNPGKDQRLELSIGRAWVRGGGNNLSPAPLTLQRLGMPPQTC